MQTSYFLKDNDLPTYTLKNAFTLQKNHEENNILNNVSKNDIKINRMNVLRAAQEKFKKTLWRSAKKPLNIASQNGDIAQYKSECSSPTKFKLNESTKRNAWLRLQDTLPWWATNIVQYGAERNIR